MVLTDKQVGVLKGMAAGLTIADPLTILHPARQIMSSQRCTGV